MVFITIVIDEEMMKNFKNLLKEQHLSAWNLNEGTDWSNSATVYYEIERWINTDQSVTIEPIDDDSEHETIELKIEGNANFENETRESPEYSDVEIYSAIDEQTGKDWIAELTQSEQNDIEKLLYTQAKEDLDEKLAMQRLEDY